MYQCFRAVEYYIGGGWLRLTAVFFCVEDSVYFRNTRKHRAEGAGARGYSENKSLSDNLTGILYSILCSIVTHVQPR